MDNSSKQQTHDCFISIYVTLRVVGVSRCSLSWPTTGHVLNPAEICDVLKAIILVTCCVLMNYIDVSMMYHVIRGQTVIKLYIFFNMLDV